MASDSIGEALERETEAVLQGFSVVFYVVHFRNHRLFFALADKADDSALLGTHEPREILAFRPS